MRKETKDSGRREERIRMKIFRKSWKMGCHSDDGNMSGREKLG